MFYSTTPSWKLFMLYFEYKLSLKSSSDCSTSSTIFGSYSTFWIWSQGDRISPLEWNFGVMTSLDDLEHSASSTPEI